MFRGFVVPKLVEVILFQVSELLVAMYLYIAAFGTLGLQMFGPEEQ
jgi:hypothetical protein